jgi:DNA-binding NarL/FixJ family response regulator
MIRCGTIHGVNRIVVIAVSELIFQSRIRAAAEALGCAVAVADTPAAADAALAAGSALAVVDLQERNVDPIAVIAAAKHAGAAVLAFGRHTDAASLRAARAAGADTVVPRSQLAEELPELLRSLLKLDPDPNRQRAGQKPAPR